MTRLERKNRTDIETFKGRGGINDVIDDFMKGLWRINDDEYDYIAEFATDDELQILLPELKSFNDKRKAINVVNKLIIEFRNK